MITLLRKVRKILIKKNSWGRYMFYTMGGILLVTVGILPALQINTWNEDKKLQETGLKTLLDLKGEFTENLQDARKVSEGNKGVYLAATKYDVTLLSHPG
ncbi:hypothetical protein [Robiginitalea aurantiaca]|nr:hypothetical protein [Robiginitalea aurantiaca]